MFHRRIRTAQALILVILGFVLAVGPTSEFLAGNSTAIRWVAASIGVAFGVLVVRTLRLAVVAESHRVIVRNVFRTYRVPSSSIDRFDAPGAYGRLWKAGLVVRLHSGHTISASAFVLTQVNFDDSLGARVTGSLNAWLHEGLGAVAPERPLTGGVLWLWRSWVAVVTLVTLLAVALLMYGIVDPTSVSSA